MYTQVLHDRDKCYILYRGDDRHVLCVLCGGAAMFEVCVPLNDDDARNALADKAYLDDLAGKVAYSPGTFAQYSVPSPFG